MKQAKTLVPRSCQSSCIVLATDAGVRGSDPALPMLHFPCAWRAVAQYARSRVIAALTRYPIGRFRRQLTKASGGNARLLADGVASRMASDDGLVEDMLQDVALAMHAAVLRGSIYAAIPALFGWVKSSTYRIVVRSARSAALLAMSRSPLGPEGSDFELQAETFEAGAIWASSSSRPGPDEERLLVRRFLQQSPERGQRLTQALREALDPWLDGTEIMDIAKRLGISRVAASLRVMRARRLLLGNGE